jgi:hypothetical protein
LTVITKEWSPQCRLLLICDGELALTSCEREDWFSPRGFCPDLWSP